MYRDQSFLVCKTLDVIAKAVDAKGFSLERHFSVISTSARTGVEVLSDAIDWIEHMDKEGHKTYLTLLDGSIPFIEDDQ